MLIKETSSAKLKQEWKLFKRCWIVHIFSERARVAHLGILQPETLLTGKPQDSSVKDVLTLLLGTDFSALLGSLRDQNLDSVLGAIVAVFSDNHMWLSLLSPIPCMHAKLLRSCLTLWDTMDRSLSGSSIHGISQARILEWVAISFSRGSSWPRDWTCISYVSWH